MTEISGALNAHIRRIRATANPAYRFVLAVALMRTCQEAERKARLVRNEVIRLLCAESLPDGKPRGSAETARLLGMRLPTVKGIIARGIDQ